MKNETELRRELTMRAMQSLIINDAIEEAAGRLGEIISHGGAESGYRPMSAEKLAAQSVMIASTVLEQMRKKEESLADAQKKT